MSDGQPSDAEQQLIASLEENFTIEKYLKLRETTDLDSPFWILTKTGGPAAFDYMEILKEDFEKYGVDPKCMIGIADGDYSVIDSVCLMLLKALSDQQMKVKEEPHAVSRGLAIGNSIVDFMLAVIPEATQSFQTPLPYSYHILLKSRLGIHSNKNLKVHEEQRVRDIACWIKAAEPEISTRKLAKKIGVHHSTVGRWFNDEKFQLSVAQARMFQDSVPNSPTDLAEIAKLHSKEKSRSD